MESCRREDYAIKKDFSFTHITRHQITFKNSGYWLISVVNLIHSRIAQVMILWGNPWGNIFIILIMMGMHTHHWWCLDLGQSPGLYTETKTDQGKHCSLLHDSGYNITSCFKLSLSWLPLPVWIRHFPFWFMISALGGAVAGYGVCWRMYVTGGGPGVHDLTQLPGLILCLLNAVEMWSSGSRFWC